MRSVKSYFDKTLYTKTFLRFWPIWAANLVVWVMALPLTALTRLQSDLSQNLINSRLERFALKVGDQATQLGLVVTVGLGILAAMAVCSHLYSSKSANFMAALPVRREGQFVSYYLAGLTGLLAPNVIVFLLTLLVEAVGHEVWLLPLGYWLLAVSVMEFFFYSFAVCLGQFTGHILALPVYYGVFNILVLAVYALVEEIMRTFYYGFAGFSSLWEQLAYWCTPVLAFAQMDCKVHWENDVLIQRIDGGETLAVYAAAALVLTVCALLLYRKRHMETAGDVVAVSAMRPVFKYGVAVCAGFAGGILSALVLDLEEPGLMVAIVLWGIVGYFAAQMFLDKSFKVFRKWKGAAALSGAFLLLFAVIAFDLTGFETRVPRADEVVSVNISGLGGDAYDSGNNLDETVTDPVVMERVIALHRAAVEHRSDGSGPIPADAASASWNVTMEYTLKNGTVISRRYRLYDTSDRANTPGSVWYAVEQIVSDRAFMWKVYGFDRAEELERQGIKLGYAEYNPEKYHDTSMGKWDSESRGFTPEEGEALLAAVKQDYVLGHIGRKHAKTNTEPVLGRLIFQWDIPGGSKVQHFTGNSFGPAYEDVWVETSHFYLDILVTEDSANTLAMLEELGGWEVEG